MGTRADFYVGRGVDAEWLGSIALDGYPQGLPVDLFHQRTESEWRGAVVRFLGETDHATTPDQGWPWPWENSHTTDYSYAFDTSKVWATNYGYVWFDPLLPEPERESDTKETAFPDMTSRRNVTYGKRSGFIVLGRP